MPSRRPHRSHEKKSHPAVKPLLTALIVLLVILAIAAVALGTSTSQFRKSDVIAPHVSVAGVDVGKLKSAEAQAKLEAEWLPTLPKDLAVIVGDETHKLPCDKLGRKPLLEQAVAKAWRVGREGNLLAQLGTRLRMLRSQLDIPVEIAVDQAAISAQLVRLSERVDHDPVDAQVSIAGGDVVSVAPGKAGVRLNRQASAEAITSALQSRQTEPVKLVYKEIKPRVSAADLAHLEVVLGGYSTPYNSGQANRTKNLSIAVQAINKSAILAGEEFSTDKAIGPRLAERGFREAPIFIGTELVPGTGGGICQIATTIYNAALFAGLAILERHKHVQPIPYAPAGRDATVYAGQQDMRFRNTTGAPILLLASMDGDTVTIRIIGKREANRKVRLERTGLKSTPYTTKEIPDPTLELGRREDDKPGKNGVQVTLIRVIVQPDGTEKRETLHTDVYQMQPEVVKVGTKPAFYKDKDGKPILGPDGKPVPVKLGPDGKRLPYKPPAKKPDAKPKDTDKAKSDQDKPDKDDAGTKQGKAAKPRKPGDKPKPAPTKATRHGDRP